MLGAVKDRVLCGYVVSVEEKIFKKDTKGIQSTTVRHFYSTHHTFTPQWNF